MWTARRGEIVKECGSTKYSSLLKHIGISVYCQYRTYNLTSIFLETHQVDIDLSRNKIRSFSLNLN